MKRVLLLLVSALVATACTKDDGKGYDYKFKPYRKFPDTLKSSNRIWKNSPTPPAPPKPPPPP